MCISNNSCASFMDICTRLEPGVKIFDSKNTLNAPAVYFTYRSKAVVLVLFLSYVALCFFPRGISCRALPCSLFSFFFFSVMFSIAITSVGAERAGLYASFAFEPHRDKTNKMACARSEDADQPGHPPSLIRVFTVRLKKAWVLSYRLSSQRRL